jgi:hypothetical protein
MLNVSRRQALALLENREIGLLYLTLEDTLSHAVAMHAPNQLVALPKAIWEPDTLDY